MGKKTPQKNIDIIIEIIIEYLIHARRQTYTHAHVQIPSYMSVSYDISVHRRPTDFDTTRIRIVRKHSI